MLRIGKLIVNFSSLELECIHWLVQLTEDLKSLGQFTDVPFAKRVNELQRHIKHRPCSVAWRKQAMNRWQIALKMAKVRNHVAHNPVVFFWSTPVETGEPDFVGIPSIRGGSSPGSRLSRKEVDHAIDEVARIAQDLHKLRVEWCAARDAGSVPAPLPIRSGKLTLWQRFRKVLKSLGTRRDA